MAIGAALLLLGLLLLSSCVTEIVGPPGPAGPAGEPGTPGSLPQANVSDGVGITHYDIEFTPAVGGDVENATLRAIDAWEQATKGFVSFNVHSRTDPRTKCSPSLILIDEVTKPEKVAEDDVAYHEFDSSKPVDCHSITIVNPWANQTSFMATFNRLGVNPLVAVMAHELGHVLGLPHSSTTSHSVMTPFIQLSPVTFPTCLDVNMLSIARKTLIECAEPR